MGKLADLHKAATQYTAEQWATVARSADEAHRLGSLFMVNLLPQFRGQWAFEVQAIEKRGWKLEYLTPMGDATRDGVMLATFRSVL